MQVLKSITDPFTGTWNHLKFLRKKISNFVVHSVSFGRRERKTFHVTLLTSDNTGFENKHFARFWWDFPAIWQLNYKNHSMFIVYEFRAMPNCITEETIHNSMTDSRRELTGFNYRSYSTKRPSCIKKMYDKWRGDQQTSETVLWSRPLYRRFRFRHLFRILVPSVDACHTIANPIFWFKFWLKFNTGTGNSKQI